MAGTAEFPSLPASLTSHSPQLGIVLGSGLAPFAEELKSLASADYSEIPGLPMSKVPGHQGSFLVAEIEGRKILIARGRVHLYEGWSAREVTAGIRCMHALGVRRLVLTNAAGTVNPDFPPGHWMMLRDHLNLTGTSPLTGGPNFVDMSEAYSKNLRAIFRSHAEKLGITLHEGVYASLRGPQYETPAEIAMMRTLGADAVGMSTVLETIQARALGMEVAAFSCLTNWGAGITGETIHHQEVLDVGRNAARELIRLFRASLPEMA